MIFSCLAPVLSAQKILLPIGRPRATCGLYSTIPFALTALVLGAGILCHFRVSAKSELFFFNVLMLGGSSTGKYLLDSNKRNLLAYWAAFDYSHAVPILQFQARRVMRKNPTTTTFIPHLLLRIVQMSSLDSDRATHLRAHDRSF